MNFQPSCSPAVLNIEVKPADNYLMTQPNSENFKLCPLCNSEVKLFFINFNEKLLMCKNTECEYPFGYEELQYFKEDEDKCSETEVMSIRDSFSQTFTYAGSTACWSDINKMHQIVDSDENNLENGALDIQEYMLNPIEPTKTKTMQLKENIEKNVEEISNLTNTLSNTNNKKLKMLKNRKWIHNLMNLQKKTGAKLVKPIEMEADKSKEMFGGGELTINIGPPDNELSSLKIEIKND